MTTNHFFGGWEGVCALGKKKKEKKEGKTWRAECEWSEPLWRVDVGGGALLCERNIGVWCSYELNRIVQCVK